MDVGKYSDLLESPSPAQGKYADLLTSPQPSPAPAPNATEASSADSLPQASPSALPSPPAESGAPGSLSEALRAVTSFPGRAFQTATNITGGLLTGDIAAPEFNPRPTDQDLQRSIISPETATEAIKSAFPVTRLTDVIQKLYPTQIGSVAQGLVKGGGDVVSSLFTPENAGLALATGPLAGLGKAAQLVLAGAFGTQAALQVPDQWKAYNATEDPAEKARIAVQIVAGLGAPALGALHAALPGKAVRGVVEPPPLPLSESARAEIAPFAQAEPATLKPGDDTSFLPQELQEGSSRDFVAKRKSEGVSVEAAAEELKKIRDDATAKREALLPEGSIVDEGVSGHFVKTADGKWRGIDPETGKVTPDQIGSGVGKVVRLGPAVEPPPLPAAPAEAAAAEAAPGKKVEGPALVDDEGKVIMQGTVGETHADLMAKALGTDKEDAALSALENDAQHAFVDTQGNVLNREQAGELARASGQVEEGHTGPLQSQHLKPTAEQGTGPVTLNQTDEAGLHAAAKAVGAEFTGVQKYGEGIPDELLFTDKTPGKETTIAVPDGTTPDELAKRFEAKRAEYAAAEAEKAGATTAAEPATEPAAPVPPTKPRRGFQLPYAPLGQPDIIDLVVEHGGVKSRNTASALETSRSADLWDDQPDLRGVYRQILGGKSLMPDQMATIAAEEGFGDGTVSGFWKAIDDAVKARRSMRTQMAKQERQQKVFEKQYNKFQDDAVDVPKGEQAGKQEINTANLQVGDKIQVGDQELKVKGIDPDTLDVTLEDGRKYGVQSVVNGQVLYVDHAELVPREQDVFEPNKPEVPTLRPGETQGDLLSKQTEDLTLVGEKGIDHGQQAADAAAAEAEKQKAQAAADAQQTKLPLDQPEAVTDGVRPEQQIVKGATDPKAAGEISPQALGVVFKLPSFLQSMVDYFVNNTPSQIWNSIRGGVGGTLGKTFSKTTVADRTAGELGARWISARTAAPYMSETFVNSVLEGTGVDPVKFGAALTEDNLRSIRAGLMATDPNAAMDVRSIVGAKNSPFKTEAEYQAFLSDKATQVAIDRHRALWEQVVDPMFKKAASIDPTEVLPDRGSQTGARINLYNDVDNKGSNVSTGPGAGNLNATIKKKSPFAIQARGTGDNYNVNYNDMMANTFGRQLEIAAKNEFEDRLVESGNAVIGKPGLPPVLPDGEETVAFPIKRQRAVIVDKESGTTQMANQSQNIYVRKSLAPEYRRGADIDLIRTPAFLRAFNKAINQTALAGLTDASVHVLNQLTSLFTRPGVVGSVLTDSLLSTFGRADVPVTITKFIIKSLKDNQEQLSQLAQIGAVRGDYPTSNPLGKFIGFTDKITRLMLDDAYKGMVDAGLIEANETNRREFVNQVGQYNRRAQGDLRRLARDSGFGPFATAGTTFNTLGLRTMTGSAGVSGTSAMAGAALRANVYSKFLGGMVLAGTINYLLTKDKGGGVMGRPGVAVGKIDTGLNDENGRPLSIPLFDVLGLGRALRVTGVRGLVESQRKGLTLQNSFDSAATDIWNTNISPFIGPPLRFLAVASSGKPYPAINVPRSSRVVAPGESQTAENIKEAVIEANPVLKSIALSQRPGEGIKSALRQQIPRLTLQPSQSAEFMSKYPEIVRKAQAREYINDVIRLARNMAPNEQEKFVQESLTRLAPEDQKQARRTLKYSRIRTGEAGNETITIR